MLQRQHDFAGYIERTAKQMGQENLTKPYILEYMEKRNKQLQNERTANRQEVREFCTSVLKNAEKAMAHRLKASEFIEKTNGAFIDKVEHSEHRT